MVTGTVCRSPSRVDKNGIERVTGCTCARTQMRLLREERHGRYTTWCAGIGRLSCIQCKMVGRHRADIAAELAKSQDSGDGHLGHAQDSGERAVTRGGTSSATTWCAGTGQISVNS